MQVLKRGSRGPLVVVLKQQLLRHNRWSRALGFTQGFGPVTERQVKRFQNDRGLITDGQVGPQTWAALKGVPVSTNGERAKAVNLLQSQVGVTEHPPGSNWGHPVQDYLNAAGYDSPEPWCQAFAAWVADRTTNGRVPARQIGGYTVGVVDMAKAHRFGLMLIPIDAALPGDWVYFAFDGGGIEHVETFLAHQAQGTILTVGGNTSFEGAEGSQSNGGCVARRHRNIGTVAAVVRVPYKN